MAIYQFQLTAIPRQAVFNKFGHIPEQLDIDYEERRHHYYLREEGLLENTDVFKDALTQAWWKGSDLLALELVHEVDKVIRRAQYSTDTSINWKFNNGRVDNDAVLYLEPESGKIRSFSFRADLREPELICLRTMVGLANNYDWLLMDDAGRLAPPQFKAVAKLLLQSNAFKFLENPKEYIDNLRANH